MMNEKCKYNDYFYIADVDITLEEKQYLSVMKMLIIDLFQDVGAKFDYERLVIVKNTNESFPIFFSEGRIIMLSVKKFSYWCQLIYQLSHELTHAFIYFNNKDSAKKIKWIEETICEAVSLYFLNYFSINWNNCILSHNDPNYKKCIYDYLYNEVNKKEKETIKNTYTKYANWDMLNEKAEEKRDDRALDRNNLYRCINKTNLLGLLNYRDYVKDGHIDSTAYKGSYINNEAVEFICELYDEVILKFNEIVSL